MGEIYRKSSHSSTDSFGLYISTRTINKARRRCAYCIMDKDRLGHHKSSPLAVELMSVPPVAFIAPSGMKARRSSPCGSSIADPPSRGSRDRVGEGPSQRIRQKIRRWPAQHLNTPLPNSTATSLGVRERGRSDMAPQQNDLSWTNSFCKAHTGGLPNRIFLLDVGGGGVFFIGGHRTNHFMII